jgi:hypothetical protein
VEVTPDATEEDVTPAETVSTEQAGAEEPEVRVGLVAVPGEVTVGVADDDASTDVVTQPVSTTDQAGSPSDTVTGGAASDTQQSDTSGADGADSGDGGGSDSGGGSGDSE